MTASVFFYLAWLHAATADDTYKRGKELFEQTYFEQAAPLLKAFLEDPGDASAAKVTRARWMLAQSLFFGGDKAGAGREVRALLKKGGDVPGEKDWPPDFADYVAGIRAKTAVAAPPPPPQPRPRPKPVEPKERVSQPEITAHAVPKEQLVHPEVKVATTPEPPPITPWYLRGIPFGVGHFIAGDYVGGGIFATLSVATLVSNIAFTVVNGKNRLPDGSYPDNASYPTLYVMQHVTAALFYATAIASIIDGIVFVPGRVKPVSVTALPFGTGGALVVRGQF